MTVTTDDSPGCQSDDPVTKRVVVVDRSDEHPLKPDYAREYDCGHLGYGPPTELPRNCPACTDDDREYGTPGQDVAAVREDLRVVRDRLDVLSEVGLDSDVVRDEIAADVHLAGTAIQGLVETRQPSFKPGAPRRFVEDAIDDLDAVLDRRPVYSYAQGIQQVREWLVRLRDHDALEVRVDG